MQWRAFRALAPAMHKIATLCILAASAGAQIPLPAQSGSFSSASATRGLFFMAPVPFTLVGVRAPDPNNTGIQNIEIYKLNAMPPTYPATATSTHIFFAVGQPSKDILPCSLFFNTGDYLAVLGGAGASTLFSSYGPANSASNVLGAPITLQRFLTQTSIITTGGNQPFSHENGSIGRIELYVAGMNAAIDYGTGTPSSSTAVAPRLTTTARPILGQNAVLSLTNNDTGAIASAIALAIGRATIPFFNGTVLINPPVYVSFSLGALPVGPTPLTIPIPNNPALAGSPPLDFQGFVVVGSSLGMTNGTEWWLGL